MAKMIECINCGEFYENTTEISNNLALVFGYCSSQCSDADSEDMAASTFVQEDYKTETEIAQESVLKTVIAGGGFNLKIKEQK